MLEFAFVDSIHYKTALRRMPRVLAGLALLRVAL
jgi:hypothetical protein